MNHPDIRFSHKRVLYYMDQRNACSHGTDLWHMSFSNVDARTLVTLIAQIQCLIDDFRERGEVSIMYIEDQTRSALLYRRVYARDKTKHAMEQYLNSIDQEDGDGIAGLWTDPLAPDPRARTDPFRSRDV